MRRVVQADVVDGNRIAGSRYGRIDVVVVRSGRVHAVLYRATWGLLRLRIEQMLPESCSERHCQYKEKMSSGNGMSNARAYVLII